MYALPELTGVATNYGINVVFLSDSMVEYIQYGLPPLHHAFWAGWNNRSVLRLGPNAYLAAVARENARQTNVLYIPGVEITPRFHWTGSLLKGDLTCHNHQRNLIALGINSADLIRGIPITAGYATSAHVFWRWVSWILCALFLLALAMFMFGAPYMARRSRFPTCDLRRSIFSVALVPLLALIIGLNLLAGRKAAFDLYSPDQPSKFEQHTLNYLAKHDIPCFWAHPEASDLHNFSLAGLSLTIRTDPYPEILRQTTGYTGFAGINEGRNDLIMPKSAWDNALLRSFSESNHFPPWCFGEMLYHYEGQAGKKMGNVQTMIWSKSREPAAIMEAVRAGRFYARRNDETHRLKLETWQASGGLSGEHARAMTPQVPICLAVSSSIPGTRLDVKVLRNGIPIREETLEAPFKLEFEDTPPNNEPVYYRALVLGRHPVKLVTNPIFITR